MPSPNGTYRLYSDQELADLLVTVKERIASGDMESMSGAGKSHTIKRADAHEMLRDISFEMQRRGGTLPPTIVYQNTSGITEGF